MQAQKSAASERVELSLSEHSQKSSKCAHETQNLRRTWLFGFLLSLPIGYNRARHLLE